MRQFASDDVMRYRQRFFRDGYLVLPCMVPEALMNEVHLDIVAVINAASGASGASPPTEDVDATYLTLRDTNPGLKSRAYDLLGLLQSVRQVFGLANLQEVVRPILDSPVIVDGIQARIDDASNDRLLPMHQEMAQMSLINVTAWIPLQDIRSVEDGGLRVIPGSHRNGFLPHRLFDEPHPYYGVCEDQFDPSKELRIDMSAGDVMLFHPLLIHGSVPNENSQIRWTLVARFNALRTLCYLESGERHYPLDRSQPVYQRYNTGFEWMQ